MRAGTCTPASPPACAAQLPAFDQAFSTLIRDLDRMGKLDDTLGHGFDRIRPHAEDQCQRRPRPLAQGVQRRARRRRQSNGATIYGSSNAVASEPEDDPIEPPDLATTIYHQLGIVADKELMAPGNRPIEIVDGGQVRKELLA